MDNERYSIKYPVFSDKDIKENIKVLAEMESVAFIDKSKLEKTGKNVKELYLDFFNSLGNNIYSETFGDISLSNSSAKSEIRHGNTAEKIASIEAIPIVIKKGKVIFSKRKYGTDVDRIIVAAPIEIGADGYYMGVMLQRDTQNQRLYLHNVVSIKIEETKFTSQDDSLTNWSDEENPRLFITSILKNVINVKFNKQKNDINDRKSKIPEKNGVTGDDLTKGDDSFKDAEDNSDIIVHPPAPKKKVEKKEAPKAEAKKETKKSKKPLKITKALTEDEARNIVAYIMEDHFKEITEDTKIAYLPGDVRKNILGKLTHIAGTNDMEAYVGKVYEVAELLCNEAVIREQYDISDRADVDEAYRTVEILDSYKGKINLEAIREDIKSVYDTRATHLVRTWGAKKTRGVSTDVIKEELAEYGIRISRDNEADIFTDMISIYDQAESIIDEAEKSITIKVKDLFVDDPAGKSNLIENVADDLHTLFNKNLEREYFKTYSKLITVCKKFNDLKKGTYINATKDEDRALTAILNELKGLRGGLLSVNSIEKTFEFLNDWYTKKNESIKNHFDPGVRDIIDEVRNRQKGPLNVIELKNILKVFQRIHFLLENYTKLYRNGEYVDVDKAVRNDIDNIITVKENDNSIVRNFRRMGWHIIADPQFVCELLDGYKTGFATSLLNELREGGIKCSKIRMDLLKDYDKFAKENQKYIDNLAKRTVKVQDKDVPMEMYISAYFSCKSRNHQKRI